MLYFAYGSNMSSRRLSARIKAKKVCVARLPGYKLAFEKVGKDGSGKCSLKKILDGKGLVYGVVWEFGLKEKEKLDAFEGLGMGYSEKQVTVFDCLTDRPIRAYLYDATWLDPHLLPFGWYKVHVLKGALENGFPREYVKRIISFKAVRDHNPKRARRELAIYKRPRVDHL